VIRAHQPGSEPIDIPETIPNPVVVPKPTPTPTEPAPKEPVRIPEKVPHVINKDEVLGTHNPKSHSKRLAIAFSTRDHDVFAAAIALYIG
jgi:hypothetical protein